MIAATVTGNVGRDAQVRDVDGTSVMSFTIASRRYEKGQEQTDWVDVSFWGQRASKIAQYVTKGSRVAVRGTVWMREYTHNNERRYSLTMRADDVELLGGGERSDAKPAAADSRPQHRTTHHRDHQPAPSADDIPF